MAVPYGYWLNHIGQLSWGMKLHGCADVTKEEYTRLFAWPQRDRNVALRGIRAIAAMAEATEAYKAALAADQEASAKADAALTEYQRVAAEHAEAVKADPAADPAALTAARKAADDAAAAAVKATETMSNASKKQLELVDIIAVTPMPSGEKFDTTQFAAATV